MYHLSVSSEQKGNGLSLSSLPNSNDLDRASLYIDGAIISTKKLEKQVSHHSGEDNMLTRSDCEIDLALNYNNRSVIELKRNRIE